LSRDLTGSLDFVCENLYTYVMGKNWNYARRFRREFSLWDEQGEEEWEKECGEEEEEEYEEDEWWEED